MFVAALLLGCHGAEVARPVAPAAPFVGAPSAGAPAASVLRLTYREPANVFEILDNVSLWWPEKCDPEYRAYWQERFGVTAADEQRFAAYKAIRERHYDASRDEPDAGGKPKSLFGKQKLPDRIAGSSRSSPRRWSRS